MTINWNMFSNWNQRVQNEKREDSTDQNVLQYPIKLKIRLPTKHPALRVATEQVRLAAPQEYRDASCECDHHDDNDQVARVCKSDVGGTRSLNAKWTSFLKARHL